jgi:membrane-bound inhibitor of C-type lysozyme
MMGKRWMAVFTAGMLFSCNPGQVSTTPMATETGAVNSDGGLLPGEYRAETWSARQVIYICAGDEELQVSYLNMDTGESFAMLYYGGRLSLMRRWVAASGARYLAIDEQSSYRWYPQGDEGFLAFLAADHTATEQIVLADCEARNSLERAAWSTQR